MRIQDLDIACIGFGPANLALAVQLHKYLDNKQNHQYKVRFLEQKNEFSWHPNMLLEGSDVQIHYLKDLVTLVDPCSYFSFVNYLKRSGRLLQFMNLKTSFPCRIEYNDYLCWAASHFTDWVEYNSKVTGIHFVEKKGKADQIYIEYTDNKEQKGIYARNVVIAAGQEPYVPQVFQSCVSNRIIHTSNFLSWLEKLPKTDFSQKVVIIGSGQSAAEVFNTLIDKYPQAKVINLMRRFGYAPADESCFNNEVFNPEFVDYFYNLPENKRSIILNNFQLTNYSAVDVDLIQTIYRKLYELKVQHQESKFYIQPHTKVVNFNIVDDGCLLEVEEIFTEVRSKIFCNYIILATGYCSTSVIQKLLKPMDAYLLKDNKDRIKVKRDYSIETTSNMRAGIYALGYAEETHGLTETLISLLPVRSAQVLESIFRRMSAANLEYYEELV
ncbi:lysine N(6)-hydroxylase/L-ornithine N(5)-oxygenase family protein [Nostoc sphaeroides]|uniref:L-lysine N6-monooxygenase MbtG n=1 Tax=Nostoc sphaeroides CCNUC1 TaxID=2653204 RepID=A0A5P8WKP8_9NOSO|nr:SidA/IucD/PvdA family monooxygenase [Nostoc sphaeroides]QFS52736.1 pvdA, L-ornithine N5-monooxygenase [Nostoc sphaeroides CCNUC1]